MTQAQGGTGWRGAAGTLHTWMAKRRAIHTQAHTVTVNSQLAVFMHTCSQQARVRASLAGHGIDQAGLTGPGT